MTDTMTDTIGLWDRDVRHDRRDALFGGRGSVRVWNLQRAPTPPFSALLACELDPDGRVGAHVQQDDPEVVIVIAGRGEATVSGAPFALAPGVVVHLPHGETLTIENASASDPLRYLIIKARA